MLNKLCCCKSNKVKEQVQEQPQGVLRTVRVNAKAEFNFALDLKDITENKNATFSPIVNGIELDIKTVGGEYEIFNGGEDVK
jgi:hypothetical protein